MADVIEPTELDGVQRIVFTRLRRNPPETRYEAEAQHDLFRMRANGPTEFAALAALCALLRDAKPS